jgi:hypothetical protein
MSPSRSSMSSSGFYTVSGKSISVVMIEGSEVYGLTPSLEDEKLSESPTVLNIIYWRALRSLGSQSLTISGQILSKTVFSS